MDEYIEAAEQAAKSAHRALILTVIAVMVAVAVLVIDNGIKKLILIESDKARLLLKQVQELAAEVRDGGVPQAGRPGGAGDAGSNGSHGLGHDAAAGADVDEAGRDAEPVPAQRPARTPRRAPGNG